MAAQVPQNLTSDFIKSRLLTLAQTSFYNLTLPLPAAVRSRARANGLRLEGQTGDLNQIELLCTDASLPGSSLATHDVTNDYHGVSEKMAYRRIYDQSFNLNFYVDREYDVIELFETWIDYISGNDDRGMSKNRHRNYRMRYPDSYREEIYLTKFEKDHHFDISEHTKDLLNYTFVGAFPQTITSMPVSYNQPDILKCSVSFSFIRYVAERSLRGARAARDEMRTAPRNVTLGSSSSGGTRGSSNILNRDVTDQIARDTAQYGNTFPSGSFNITPKSTYRTPRSRRGR